MVVYMIQDGNYTAHYLLLILRRRVLRAFTDPLNNMDLFITNTLISNGVQFGKKSDAASEGGNPFNFWYLKFLPPVIFGLLIC